MSTRSAARLAAAQRVVVKIGSTLLVEPATGTLDRDWLDGLCADVADLKRQGKEVVLVSSGAVALGAAELGLDTRRLRLAESQAAAAAGQITLAHAYQEVLSSWDITAAQVLLTLDDSESRRRYLNARNTLRTLLANGAVPVVNENDTVATEEIRYGDNDRLAARVAQMVSADHLVLLSDVDGLYTADPMVNPDAQHVAEVTALNAEILAMASGPTSVHGSGGMHTKLDAARVALAAGCEMLITSGRVRRPLRHLAEGGRSTAFVPPSTPGAARKQWIAGSLKVRGSLTLDAGARNALLKGRSLLPAGITAVTGEFDRGDAVSILGPDGTELGRGLVGYPAAEARALAGQQSARIEELLGYRGRDEMIHRDDLVLFNTSPSR